MNKAMAFALRGEGSDTLEIDVYDVIGETYFGEGVSAKAVRAQLKGAKNAKTIKLRVNSGGGDVIDGFAIYNLLNEHPARVEADVDGLAASMASVIIMAADEIRLAENAMVMIHEPWAFSIGDAEDLRAQADLLDKMRDQIANAYVARTGLERDEVLQMMAAETWLTAAEAKAKGFADVVKPSKQGKKAAKALASLDLSSFTAVPATFMAAVAQARASQTRPESKDAPRVSKENTMNEQDLIAALGVDSVGEAAARFALLNKIESALGAKGDEAQGALLAALESHRALPGVRAELEATKKRLDEHDLNALIAKAKDARKCTPAIEASVREAVASGDVTLSGAAKWLEALHPVAALAASPKSEPAPSETPVSTSGELTWNGKTYAELKPRERAQLKRENPELFAAMRSASK